MQKHTSAYYGLMLIGLIYSIPSAPMFSRVGTSTRQTATSTMRQPISAERAARRFYTPPRQSWWDWLQGNKPVEAPVTMQQPYIAQPLESPEPPMYLPRRWYEVGIISPKYRSWEAANEEKRKKLQEAVFDASKKLREQMWAKRYPELHEQKWANEYAEIRPQSNAREKRSEQEKAHRGEEVEIAQRRGDLKSRGSYISTGGQAAISNRKFALRHGRRNTFLEKAPGATKIEEAHTKMQNALRDDVNTTERENRWLGSEEKLTPQEVLMRERLRRMEKAHYGPKQGTLRAGELWRKELRGEE